MGGETIRVRLFDDSPKCPIVIYNLRTSGRHSPFYKPCGYWRCESCSKNTLQQMALHVADRTRTLDYLFQLDVPSEQASAVKKASQRSKVSSLRIRLNDGSLLIFAEEEIAGRGWSSNKLARLEVLSNIVNQPSHKDIHSHRYTLDWKAAPEVKEKHADPVLYTCVAPSLDSLRKKLSNVGVELESDYVANPYEIAEKLVNR